MAKLRGPLLSLAAAGKLGDSLIFQTWRGRPYCRKLTNPRQAPGDKQKGIRQIVALCSAYWATMLAPWKADWEAYNPGLKIPGFHKFVGYNIDRAQLDLQPVTTPDLHPPYYGNTRAYLNVDLTGLYPTFTLLPDQDYYWAWSWIIFREQRSSPPTFFTSNEGQLDTKYVASALPIGSESFVDRHPGPGPYYKYWAQQILPDGSSLILGTPH